MTTDPTRDNNHGFTPEDLTSYALGELDPAAPAHHAIARALGSDPAIRGEIDAIKHSAATVRDALAHEPVPATTSHDREGADPGMATNTLVGPLPDGRGSLNKKTIRTRTPLFARPALLAAGFALAAGAAVIAVDLLHPGTPAHIAAPDADAPRGLVDIHAALRTPVTASFDRAPLGEVFDTLHRETNADLTVDWPALEARGVTRDTPITLDADALPARDLLSRALAAAWQQLPHPDPAVWTVTTREIRVEPRSAVVQRTLDHAQSALATTNPTRARMTRAQLALADHPSWQQPGEVTEVIREQRRIATQLRAERELAQAQARLAAAEAELEAARARAAQPDPDPNELVESARLELAQQKIAEADEAYDNGQFALAAQLYEEATLLDPENADLHAKLADAHARANTELRPADPLANRSQDIVIVRQETVVRYEQAMTRASEALANREYDAARDAVVEARTVLNANRSTFSDQERNELVARAARMQSAVNETQVVDETSRMASAERERAQHESQSRYQAERRRNEQVQQRLRNARELQSNRDYEGALAELEAARFIDPSNAAADALIDIIQDVSIASEGQNLRRDLELMRSNQQLVDGEAVIPYDELLLYPGDWPELTDTRLGYLGDHGGDAFGVAANAPAEPGAAHYYARPLYEQQGQQGQQQQQLAQGVTRDRGIATETATLGRPVAGAAIQEEAERTRGEVELHEGLATDGLEMDDREVLRRQVQQQLSIIQQPGVDPNQLTRDTYALVNDNPFHTGFNDPLSTFSVDVDTAAYALVRRQVMQQNSAPVPGAVRIEELVNYFDYGYEAPVIDARELDGGLVTQASLERLAADDDTFAPFATHVEVADCPWTEGHQLVRIGIKGMEVAQEDRPAAHLTFLLDVSGSMNRENKLPLVVESMKLLLTQLNPDDHVSIVVYAGAAGVVLEHASASDPAAIEEALGKLKAGGSTAGGEGIQLAYDIADRHFVAGGINRVILCTDGDFNVGISDRDALVELIQDRANPAPDDSGAVRGVYLSVLGFGMGNLNDAMMEPLTNAGNGNYAYIDTADEAEKVMVEQVGGTLVAIAKDVKIQVEFNPSRVLAYRLIGYENRILAHRDFADDTVDAGDIGAGHTVTALYEVVPFPDDGLGDEETLREVKRQIEALDEALAFSASVLQNTPLTDEQYRKLMGSVRMMQQQRAVAVALEATVKHRPGAAALGSGGEGPSGIDLRYRRGEEIVDDLDELMVVNLRYKPVDAPAEQGTSRLIRTVVGPESTPFNDASADTRFAAAVAGYGMVLRHSPHRGDADLRWVIDTANAALGEDGNGYRAGFVALAEQSAGLLPRDAAKERNLLAPRDEHAVFEGH